MRNEAELSELFRRYLENSCTKAEIRKMLQYADTPDESMLRELIAKQFLDEKNQKENLLSAELQKLLNEVYSEISKKINFQEKKYFWIYNKWNRIIAAAAVVVILFTGLSVYRNQFFRKQFIVQQKVQRQQIVPGGNKAVLTLADGSEILLDGAANGTIAHQNNVIVRKTADGQLIYEAADQKTNEILINSVTTPKGGQFQINLPDGTKVWLNAASSLRYPTLFAGKERSVELSGEAYFEVAHDPSKPFKVITAGQELEVLGTSFNINSYPDEETVNTTLLEGSLQVTPAFEEDNDGVSKWNISRRKILKPNQQSRLTDGKLAITEINASREVAWKDGRFVFNEESMESIMRKVARWYDVDVIFKDERIRKMRFGGNVNRFAQVSTILKVFQLTGKVEFSVNGKTIAVMSAN